MLLSRFRVAGHSMVPSLLPGDEIIISSIPYMFSSPKPEDIVLLLEPHSEKRVVKRIEKVKNDTYFVRGENPSDSQDSRTYGAVSKTRVIGKMLFKLS